MIPTLLKIAGLIICVLLFGVVALYSNKIIAYMTSSQDAVNKGYYKIFGKTLKHIQTSLTRRVNLNKYSTTYKLYYYFEDIIVNLDMKKDNVTVSGLVLFIAAVSISVGVVVAFVMSSVVLFIPIVCAMFYLVTVLFRFGSLMQYEKKESEIMDAVDLLVSDVRGGIYNAIVRYKDSFNPNIRPYFLSFIDDIQNKGYDFKQAMLILNDKLGSNFTDFALKAILYEEKADDTMEDIFSSIIETNRQRRTLRFVNNIKFSELRTQFVVSFILIIGYAVASVMLDEFIFVFLTQNVIGKFLLVADIVIVAFVLSYIASIKAQSL